MRRYFLKTLITTSLFLMISTSCNPSLFIGKKKKKSEKIHTLIVDGQSQNHPNWKEWTPIILKQLHDSGLFTIDVATSPLKGESLGKFNPKFHNYDVVILLYDGDNWSERTMNNFVRYIEEGGGLIIVHAADNAFPYWKEYNMMIGLGGWGDRNETDGPYLYLNEKNELIRDIAPGPGGQHGEKHEYEIDLLALEHPIMKDIPKKWLHAEDELYGMLRGPAQNLEVLAMAYSSKEKGGSGRHEPVLFTVTYGNGRIFHTVLGHDSKALSCVGFTTTLIRGCQWVAERDVDFPVPADFPKEGSISVRTY